MLNSLGFPLSGREASKQPAFRRRDRLRLHPSRTQSNARICKSSFLRSVSRIVSCCVVSLAVFGCGGLRSVVQTPQPALSIDTASIAFGSVDVNVPATQSLTLTSTGSAPVTVVSATLTGADFSMPGATFPVTIDPGQFVELNIEFEKTSAGASTGQLVITSNAYVGAMKTISLSGTGIQHQVELNWFAPANLDIPVVGYNIYRALGGSADFERINPSPTTETTFTDATVNGKRIYDYFVRSMDETGMESFPSNLISLTIP